MPIKSPAKSDASVPAKAPAKATAKAAAKAPATAGAAEVLKPAAKAASKTAPKAAPKAAAKPVAAVKQNKAAGNGIAKADNAQAKALTKSAEATREKVKKPKLVRDSFTMPEAEYQVLVDTKKACIKAGFEVKKSELLRVGVALLQQADVAKLKQVLATLPALKAGRPGKSK